MRDKLFLKGGPIVPPFSHACLPFFYAVPVQEPMALPLSAHIFHILFNPPFFRLRHGFSLLRALPLCFLQRGYLRATDIHPKGNQKFNIRLNPESGDLTRYQRSAVNGDGNVRYPHCGAMVGQGAGIIPFFSHARCLRDPLKAWHGANRSPAVFFTYSG